MKTLVVLPSYNEKENIVKLIQRLLQLSEQFDICVVDDNSPDGTPEVIRQFLQESESSRQRVELIIRPEKDGRGGAIRRGLEWGLQSDRGYQAFIEMDCDFSHSPDEIQKGLGLLATHDIVIGARYPDGEIIGWPFRRRFFSLVSNLIARTLISWKVADYTNGFRFYNRRATGLLCRFPLRNKGYIYLSEILATCLKEGLTVGSFPITFVNRERGVSNTNLKEITSAFKGIFQIAWDYHFKK